MKNALKWFEIPVNDMDRAKSFYENILGISMQLLSINENLNMALFPAEAGSIGGALCQNQQFYKPGFHGPVVYLNADPDLQKVLDRLEKTKGKIIQGKTQVSEEVGYMAIIEDSEGNRVGLMSSR
tara:strand:+ start:56 stop:430 length:375 start_codon:yes stop_codon:yes gene_type:complete